jgi:hypothetical protein
MSEIDWTKDKANHPKRPSSSGYSSGGAIPPDVRDEMRQRRESGNAYTQRQNERASLAGQLVELDRIGPALELADCAGEPLSPYSRMKLDSWRIARVRLAEFSDD